jgi:phosphonate transport system ATP-binding protein
MAMSGSKPIPAPSAIHLEGVHVQAGQRSLLNVPQLTIATGERVAVVGPNGAGKSTLLRLLTGMVGATRGRVQVLGRELGPDAAIPLSRSEWRCLRREVGVVMQGLHLVPRLSARENVLIGALARLQGRQALRSWVRVYPAALVADADAALVALGMADRAAVRTDRLSGGERQKVSLARLQLQRARLVLADEPTSALDPQATKQVCAALLAAASAHGHTLVTVLHDLDLLPALATRVLGLAQGRILWDRPLHEVDNAALKALYAAAPGATVPASPISAEPQSIPTSPFPNHSHCTRSTA